MAIEETNYGAEDARLAVNLNNLALLQGDRGAWREAEPLLARAIRIEAAAQGPGQPGADRDAGEPRRGPGPARPARGGRRGAPAGGGDQARRTAPPGLAATPPGAAMIAGNLRQIPRGVWAWLRQPVMDISSEMIHSLLPVFVVTVLGASALDGGPDRGLAEATASSRKVFSGAAQRLAGQAQAARRARLRARGAHEAAVPARLDAWAGGLGARFLDRIGKGIRGAPRDALIADLTPPHLRGAGFGLRQSLDTVGAFAGPLLAMALMSLSADDFRAVFWVAVVPACCRVLLLVFGVEEPGRGDGAARQAAVRLRTTAAARRAYWWAVAVGAAAHAGALQRGVPRAARAGRGLARSPGRRWCWSVMSAVYALSAYPTGVLADRFDRRTLLALGFGVLILADLVLAGRTASPSCYVGFAEIVSLFGPAEVR